jgi:uncharacterized Zn finger protein (UPF0148 family)
MTMKEGKAKCPECESDEVVKQGRNQQGKNATNARIKAVRRTYFCWIMITRAAELRFNEKL